METVGEHCVQPDFHQQQVVHEQQVDAQFYGGTASERVAAVHAWQRYYGMEPRDDSRLTRMFAEGYLPMTPDQVARELMATDFIYKCTLYGELIEEFMRRVASVVKAQYGLSWASTWKIVPNFAPTALKLICLLQTGQCIPPCMPPA